MNCSGSEATGVTVLEVEHETRYGYAAPVTQAQHLAYLKPLHDAHQQLLQHELQIEPRAAAAAARHRHLRQCAHAVQPEPAAPRAARARAQPRGAGAARRGRSTPPRSPRWEDVRERLRYEAGARYDPAVEFAQPSPYVPRLHGAARLRRGQLRRRAAGGAGRAGPDAPHPCRLRVQDRQHRRRHAADRGLRAARAACARTSRT